MKSMNLKKLLNWKFLILLSFITLSGCTALYRVYIDTIKCLASTGCGINDDVQLLVMSLVLVITAALLLLFAIAASGNLVGASTTPPSADLAETPPTNAAIFSINWNKKAETIYRNGETIDIPGGNYQLSLPFSDYKRSGKKVIPDNHFNLSNNFHFGIPLLSEKDDLGNLPTNIDEAKQSNIPFSVSLTPVASNQQQLAESAEWLSAEANMPQNTLGASGADNIVRLYKPITLKQNNKVIATISSMVIEKNQMQQGNQANISLDGMYGPIKTNAKNANYGPGTFSVVLNNLDASLVQKLEKEVNDIKHLSQEKQMLMQLKMMTQLKALCKKGSTMTVTFNANSVQGPVNKQFTIDLSELINSPAKLSGAMPTDLGALFADK